MHFFLKFRFIFVTLVTNFMPLLLAVQRLLCNLLLWDWRATYCATDARVMNRYKSHGGICRSWLPIFGEVSRIIVLCALFYFRYSCDVTMIAGFYFRSWLSTMSVMILYKTTFIFCLFENSKISVLFIITSGDGISGSFKSLWLFCFKYPFISLYRH
jgi:hypothetical protein